MEDDDTDILAQLVSGRCGALVYILEFLTI